MEKALAIGVLAPVAGGYYFGGLLSGIARVAAAEGHRVVAVQTLPAGLDRGEEINPPTFRLPIGRAEIAGYIAITTAADGDYLEQLRAGGHPVVLVSGQVDGFAAPAAVPDNCSGVQQAVKHLVQHGHRRIGFAGNLRQPDMRERFAAYQDALRQHGMTPNPDWFFEATDNLESGGNAAAERLLEAQVPTSALIAATDRTAVGLLGALKAAGLNLPADQAVIGFDDAELGAWHTPTLSTVDQHVDQVGELATRLLLMMLRGEQLEPIRHRVPASLVLRESCGCATARDHLSAGDSIAGESPRQRFLRRLHAVVPASRVPRNAMDAATKHEQLSEVLERLAGVLEDAGEGHPADPSELGCLADAVFVDEPRPETAERMLWAVRQFETDLDAAMPITRRVARRALHDAAYDISISITRAHTRAELRRTGRSDITLAAQYEMDMDLLRPGRADPRRLDWLPRSAASGACLALWSDDSGSGDSQRSLRIEGVHDPAGVLDKLIGTEIAAAEFPPPELWSLAGADAADIVHVVPVSIENSERGLLAVLAPVESRTVNGRGSYNHWAAVLAVALDQEEMLSTLRRQRIDLEQSCLRERQLVRDIRGSEERYALASRAVDDGLWDWDVSSGTVYYSPRWKSMIGYAADGIGTAPGEWFDRIHPDDRDEVAAAIAAQLGGAQTALRLEHRLRAADGSYRWMHCKAVTVLDNAGAPARIVGSLNDMTERHELEEQLRRGVLHDSLTGLPSRELFHHLLNASIARCGREDDYEFTLVLLTVTGLGEVNDTYGHLEGDALLRQVAQRLRTVLRTVDTAARLGDEFAVLLDGLAPSTAEPVLERLHAALAPPFTIAGSETIKPSSSGTAPGGRRYATADEALREAEIALYRAQIRRRSTP